MVTDGHIKAIVLGFEKVRQRSPLQQELEGLIQGYVREEVLYREALALGLDRGDAIVRRRLSQKMEFLSEDVASLTEPEAEELQAYLAANQDAYRKPSRFSFQQVYFNTSKRGQAAESDAMELLADLSAQERSQERTQKIDASQAGDSLMIKSNFENESERDIERTLGRQFLEALQETKSGSWQGPIASGFGLHLVYISDRIEGELPTLSEVRDAVFRDWSSEKRQQINAEFYAALRKRYKVTIADTVIEAAADEG